MVSGQVENDGPNMVKVERAISLQTRVYRKDFHLFTAGVDLWISS